MQKAEKLINFDSLIDQYKKDNYRKLETIHHEFLYSCFHPLDKDLVINIEKSYYPQSLKVFNLKQGNTEEVQEEVAEDDAAFAGGEEGEEGDDASKRPVFVKQKTQKLDEDKNEADVNDINLEKKDQEEIQQFEFEEPVYYQKEEKEIASVNQSYAISIWKLNKGNQPMQVNEYQLAGQPYQNKFFISSNGQALYIFLCHKPEDESESPKIKKIAIFSLSSKNPLSLFKILDMPSEIDVSNITGSSLKNFKSGSPRLYIRTNVMHYFINIYQPKQKFWQFDSHYDQDPEQAETYYDEDHKTDYERDEAFYGNELQYHQINIKKIFFKQDDDRNIYVLASSKYNETYFLYKVKWNEPKEKFFTDTNKIWEWSGEYLNSYYDVCANSTMTQIGFYVYGKLLLFSKDREDDEVTTSTVNNVSDCYFRKNSFLYSDIWALIQNDTSELFIVDLKNPKGLTEFENFEFGGSNLFDVGVIKPEEFALIGMYDQYNQALIQVNYLMKNEQPTVNYMNEISDRKAVYPLIFFVKGTQEIMIQSLYNSKQILRLMIDDFFLCFVDINENFSLEYNYETAHQNSSISFLTQASGKIFLNVLKVDIDAKNQNFRLFKSKLSISRKDLKYEPVIKAAVIKASRKDVKGNVDYLLVMQYQTQIFIKSFFSPYSYTEKFPLVQVPMLFFQNPTEQTHDKIFYLVKDGLTIKMQKIYFDKGKNEAVTTVYEFKSNNAQVFQKHNDDIYIMDESYQLKQLEMDEKAEKFKITNYEFNQYNKDNLELTSYEEVVVTDSTLLYYDSAYFFYGTKDHSKNYDYTNSRTLFQQKILQGATRINGMNKLMYVLKGDSTDIPDVREFQADDELIKSQGLKTPSKNQEEEDKEADADKFSEPVEEAHEGARKNPNRSEVANSAGMSAHKSGSKVLNLADDPYLYSGDSYTDESNSVYIAFIPFVDSNEITLKCNNKDFQIQYSTFIDEEDNILLYLKNYSEEHYQIFSKNGHYQYKAKFYKDNIKLQDVKTEFSNLELIQFSDNMKYILCSYLNQDYVGTFAIFEIVKDAKTSKIRFNYVKSVKREDQNNHTYYNRLGQAEAFIDNQMNVYQGIIIADNKNEQGQRPDDFQYIKIFKNGEEIFQKLYDESDLIFKQEKGWDYITNLQYEFTSKYLILIVQRETQQEIEYYNLELANPVPVTINLVLDQNTFVKRILTTEKPDLVQIAFEDSEADSLYIATWDMVKNIEYAMIEVPQNNLRELAEDDYYTTHSSLIVKGFKQKLNYIVQQSGFYDLQFGLPFSFIECYDERYDEIQVTNISKYNEKKLSSTNNSYLGLYQLETIFQSYTLRDLFYWETISDLKADQWNQSLIHLEFFTKKFESQTILHYYALESRILQLITEEVMKQESDEADNPYKKLFFIAVYPNDIKNTPFSIAVHNQSPKSVEAFIDMFIKVPDYKLSQFIRNHFDELFQMGLTIFEQYLDVCFYKHESLKQTKNVKWTLEGDEDFIDFHTSYIGNDFYQRLLHQKIEQKKTTQKQRKQIKLQQSMKGETKNKPDNEETKDVKSDKPNLAAQVDAITAAQKLLKQKQEKEEELKKISELDIYDKPNDDNHNNEMKRVEFSVLEFDWIFQGKTAINFINNLAETDNDNLFAISSVKIIILFLWKKFFPRILLIIFFPFVSYMVFFLVYVTYIFQRKLNDPEDTENTNLHIAFVVIVLFFIFMFSLLEIRQMFLHKLNYLKSFWNMIDLISICANVSFVAIDLAEVDPQKIRPLGAACIMLMWIKLFYFLRLFQPTAAMIRMIVQICKDMYTFAAVLALAMIGFGNCFYIYALNIMQSDDPDAEPLEPFTGGNFLMALIYSFRTGLGDFNTDGYMDVYADPWLWIIFLLNAILIQIVLLNLLIAIMGDTYDKVTELGEQSKLKEMCSMISENEFVLNRNKIFRNSKYIIVAKLEKADSAASASWEGKISTLKTAFQAMLGDQKKETKSMFEGLKEDMSNSYRAIEQKFQEGQGVVMKQNQSIAAILSEIKGLGNKIDVVHTQNQQASYQQQQLIQQQQQQIKNLLQARQAQHQESP